MGYHKAGAAIVDEMAVALSSPIVPRFRGQTSRGRCPS